ncbi:hypothetical protein CORC01_13665 [Colletotrichum orchidophilum]|uniref:Uncharacterized protein n=1 Tax=Colletotrichum orchidophilum TaxID=1209926 RepID=A0A1G4APP9_9PEZI|nr:uncharacterized protein CORC01_13665 [Colletotrichum orchidophilum]OHE91043.1 hypothetical protein CORC01_13665 [Colletotrichum orchidophilum]
MVRSSVLRFVKRSTVECWRRVSCVVWVSLLSCRGGWLRWSGESAGPSTITVVNAPRRKTFPCQEEK